MKYHEITTLTEDFGDPASISFFLNQDPAEFSRESLLFPRGGWATLGAYGKLDGFEGPERIFCTTEVLRWVHF